MDQQQTPAPPPPQSWQAPPQQPPAGWGQQGYVAPPARPGGVTFAGVFLVILGVIALLAAALFFMGGALIGGSDLGEAGGIFAAVASFAAILFLVWGLANLFGGIGSLQGKNWGRVTGIVVSVIAVVLGVLGLVTSLGQGIDASGLVINVVILAGYAFAAWALFQAGPYFAYRR